MKKSITIIWLVLLATIVLGNNQANIEHQYTSWLRVSFRFPIGKKFFFMADVDERMFHFPTMQLGFFQRNYFGYIINKNFELHQCFVFILSHTNTPERNPDFSVPELRPHQDFFYRHRISQKIMFQHRIRLDERFIRNSNNYGLLPGYRFAFRPRYQLAFNYRFYQGKKNNALTLVVQDEVLFQFGKTIKKNFDQQRIYGGLRYDISRNNFIQVGYMHWWQQLRRDHEYYSRHILQINFLQVIDLRRKEQPVGKQ